MNRRAVIIIIAILISIINTGAGLSYGAEEAFDTKAAAAHIEKGLSHLKAKKYDDAIAEFEKAAAILPEAEPFYLLGYAFYMKGRTGDEESRKKAMENFEKAYELNPNYTPAKTLPTIEPSPSVPPLHEAAQDENKTAGEAQPETPAPQ